MSEGRYDPNREERPASRIPRRTGPAIHLTGLGVRLALTALVIGLGALVIYFAIQFSQSGNEPVAVPTIQPTVDTSSPLATFTPGPTSTPPPQDIPPTVPPTVPPPAAGTLGAGGKATISGTGGSGANLRSDAGTSFGVVRILDEGAAVDVLEGPTDADGFVWWRIRTAEGEEGWVAQDFLSPQ